MPADQIDLLGSNTELRHLPGLAGEPVAISGVELRQRSRQRRADAAGHARDRPEHRSLVHAGFDHRDGPCVRPCRARRSERCDLLLPGRCAWLHANSSPASARSRSAGRRSPARRASSGQVHLLRSHGRQDLCRESPGRTAAYGEPVCRRCAALAGPGAARPSRRLRRRARRSAFGSSSGSGTVARARRRRPCTSRSPNGWNDAGVRATAASCSWSSAAPASPRWSASSAPGCC